MLSYPFKILQRRGYSNRHKFEIKAIAARAAQYLGIKYWIGKRLHVMIQEATPLAFHYLASACFWGQRSIFFARAFKCSSPERAAISVLCEKTYDTSRLSKSKGSASSSPITTIIVISIKPTTSQFHDKCKHGIDCY